MGDKVGEGNVQKKRKTTLHMTSEARIILNPVIQVSPMVGESSIKIPTGIPICTMASQPPPASESSQRGKILKYFQPHIFYII